MAQRITRGVLVTNLNDIADLTELSVSRKRQNTITQTSKTNTNKKKQINKIEKTMYNK